MFGIALDSLILFGLLQLLQGDAHELYEVVLVAIGMSVVNLVIVLALGSVIGVFAIVPMLMVDGLILMFYLRLPISHAAIVLAVLGGCKVALALLVGQNRESALSPCVGAMNLSISFTDAESNLIQSTAARLGVAPEDLVREAALKFATREEGEFQQTSDYVLRKNDELYQRLS